MWQEQRPEALRDLPLSILLHRAWLERKKNFENVIDFPKYNPFGTWKSGSDRVVPPLLAAKAGLANCPARCAECCTRVPGDEQAAVGLSDLEKIGDRLSSGECSGLVSLVNYRESVLAGALQDWTCTIALDPARLTGGAGRPAEDKQAQLCTRLQPIIRSGAAIAPLILVSGDFEDTFQLLVRLTELRLSVLILCFDLSDCSKNAHQPVEEYGRFGAMVRILNPQAELRFACSGACRQQTALLEQYALNAGFNAISCPSEETVSLAKDLGLVPRFRESCCLIRRQS